MQDPFELLGAPRKYDLDLAAVEKTHRELSRELHPDKFASAGASEKKAALDKAASVNEAWRIVRDPIRRAEALFALAGIAVAESSETATMSMPPSFLMEMLEAREALSEARAKKDLDKVRELGDAIRARFEVTQAKLAEGLASDAPRSVVSRLGEMRFYKRFLEEVDAIEDEAAG
jgi:molecular chaperone HscB